MGSIMAVGVAVSNAILLVSFAQKHLKGDVGRDAAVEGVRAGFGRPDDRVRNDRRHGAVALGLGEGGE